MHDSLAALGQLTIGIEPIRSSSYHRICTLGALPWSRTRNSPNKLAVFYLILGRLGYRELLERGDFALTVNPVRTSQLGFTLVRVTTGTTCLPPYGDHGPLYMK